MILEHEQWCFGYDQILKDCRPSSGNDGSSKTALLLCNADVDAMSSARILSYMLRSDGVHYQLLPCHNYSDLRFRLESMADQIEDAVRAIVLLNFGAAFNLTELYTASPTTPSQSQLQARPNKKLLGDNVKIYVMDCRRPIHLANVYSPSSVVVFLDSTQDQNDMPSDGDNLSGEESSSSEDDDSDSDSDSDSDNDSDNDSGGDHKSHDEDEEEANFDDIVGDAPKAAKEHGDPSYDAEDEDDGNNNDDTREANPSLRESKRQKTDSEKKGDDDGDGEGSTTEQHQSTTPQQHQSQQPAPRELHRMRRQRLRKYYSDGSFYGSPASFVAYKLATQNRYGEQGDLLWLACVGVTDAYLHSRLDLIGYAKLATDLTGVCAKLYPSSVFDRALNTVYAEDLVGSSSSSSNNRGSTQTKLALSENGRIFSEKDFRFFLLRHSSLLDSMQYSEYICTKLQLYTKKGEQQLLEMLARMGYPLDECKQPFAFMKPSLRRRLKEKLGTHAKEYNLDRFEFTSFTRVTGYSSLLSASDTSYAITALLEYEAPNSNKPDDGNDGTTAPEHDPSASSVEAFNNAYDALGSHCSEPIGGTWNSTTAAEGYDSTNLVNGGTLSTTFGIGAGLRYAMVLQKSILKTAIGLVERGGITLLKHFRYAHVTSSTSSTTMGRGGGDQNGHLHLRNNDLIQKRSSSSGNDKRNNSSSNNSNSQNLFSKPLALTRLAHFLMDMNRENGKWTGSRARPLLLIADKPHTNTCLIVGYEYPERAGDFVKNSFGKHFETTSKSMNGRFRFDSFDSNVVEVDSGDAQRFMEQLHYLLDAM